MSPKILAEHAEHDIIFAQRHAIPMDDTPYYDEQLGIVSVDQKRWHAAQDVEQATWFSLFPHLADDRSEEHRLRFDNYQQIPMQCGDVLEIGCGPFTQARSILNGRSVDSLTLLDPLLTDYLDHPHCAYQGGLFYGYRVNMFAITAEKLPLSLRFDLAICINVLEHVQDTSMVVNRLIASLKPGGLLVLGEQCHDEYHPADVFNLAHPIMLKQAFFHRAVAGLTPVYLNNQNGIFYLIAQNKATSCSV